MVPFSIIFVGEFCVTIYRLLKKCIPNRNWHSTEQKRGLGTTANSPAQRYDKLRFLLKFCSEFAKQVQIFRHDPADIARYFRDHFFFSEVGTFKMWVQCGYILTLPKRKTHSEVSLSGLLVEIVGVEPTTPCLQSRCSSQLSYTPLKRMQRLHFFLILPNLFEIIIVFFALHVFR